LYGVRVGGTKDRRLNALEFGGGTAPISGCGLYLGCRFKKIAMPELEDEQMPNLP
jgi:hypothetical protein